MGLKTALKIGGIVQFLKIKTFTYTRGNMSDNYFLFSIWNTTDNGSILSIYFVSKD